MPLADDRLQVSGHALPLPALVPVLAGAPGPGQAVPVAGDGVAGVLAQVVPQVPPVRDLGRVRGAVPGGLRVELVKSFV